MLIQQNTPQGRVYEYAAEDAAECQADDAYCAVDQTDLGGAQAEAAFGCGVEQEWVDHLYELGFGEAVQENEGDGDPDVPFPEK